MPSYFTLAHATHVEVPAIKNSRFIGDGAPVNGEEEAMLFVRGIQRGRAAASHHCFAWRLESGDQGWRVFDDGEPAGTAGKPILARIDGADLRGVVVVVSRYFGGTKLGKGGLIRAYGGVASALISAAEVIVVRQTQTVRICHGYADKGVISSVLRGMKLTPTEETFGVQIDVIVEVPLEEVSQFERLVCDRTSGRVNPKKV